MKKTLLRRAFLASSLAILLMGLIRFFRAFPEQAAFIEENVQIRGIETIPLPSPAFSGNTSVEEAIFKRRSVREYSIESLTLEEVSQLLWAAQGVTEDVRGFRSIPSAGALYPLEIFLSVRRVSGLRPGIYYYHIAEHALSLHVESDISKPLASAALDQDWVRDAAVNIIVCAIYERTTQRYGDFGYKYVHMEAGHLGENVHLEAVSLALGTVMVGAFYEEPVKNLLEVTEDVIPLYIIPVGKVP